MIRRHIKILALAAFIALCLWMLLPNLPAFKSLSKAEFWGSLGGSDPRTVGPQHYEPHMENATLYTLCRNEDLQTLVETILSWEDRFNHRYHYDWIFLNNEPFTQEFEDITSRLVSGRAFYGIIPNDQWSVPDWINRDEMESGMQKLDEQGIQYAMNENYRHMCRYNSGFFYDHHLLKPYRYYWRVDGDTHMFCDVEIDLFKYMRENNIKYGFTLSMHENMATIPTLWEATLKFIQAYPEHVSEDNLARFITDDVGRTYNGCHFWTNFEIADGDFWRGSEFSDYFHYLDRLGGFFYERWGDAPVHSIAASLFLPREQIAHLDFIGYWHPPLTHMPSDFLERPTLRCGVNPERNFDWGDSHNCVQNYYIAQDMEDALPARLRFGSFDPEKE